VNTYYAEQGPPFKAWRILDNNHHLVEIVHTAAAAKYDVDLLNAGTAHIAHHRMLGCRVVLNIVGSSRTEAAA
jgi:hypothetical protein